MKNTTPIYTQKVEVQLENLGLYGDYYGLVITLSNGKQFIARIEEHNFDHLILMNCNDHKTKAQKMINALKKSVGILPSNL